MAAQRIVFTSPWKLGLFVFLLVVGSCFGLIYAYLALFDWSLDLSDQQTLRHLYMVLGGVAAMGLLGYVAVVTSARPLDRVMRGGSRRDKLLKELGKIDDPREVDVEKFESEPVLHDVVDRWAQVANLASEAQMAIASQRDALSTLAAKVQSASSDGLPLDNEENSELIPLIDAINGYIREATAVPETVDSEPAVLPAPPTEPPSPETVVDERVRRAVVELGHQHGDLRSFVASVARAAEELSRRAETAFAGIGSAGTARALLGGTLLELCQRNGTRIEELRHTLEGLAEEANKLAITTALRVSRLGEAGQELIDMAEDVRSLSTRYQRLVSELRLCESDQASTIEALESLVAGAQRESAHQGGEVQDLGAAGVQQLSMVLDQSAEGLQEILHHLDSNLGILRQLTGVSTGEITPDEASSSVPHDRAAPPGQEGGKIYEISELGGRGLSDHDGDPGSDDDPIYDLEQLGAVEL